MLSGKLVTVLIPVYNAEKYIVESIKSILNQSYENLEIIIVDDGSTDGSLEAVSQLDDKRIRVYRNENNLGIAATLNIGIEYANGFYIARHDADDISLPDRIKIQTDFLDKHSETQVVSSSYIEVNDTAHEYRGNFIPELLTFLACPVHHPGTMYRRDFVIEHNCRYHGKAEDFFFWNQIYAANGYKRNTFINLKEPLFEYRVHKGQYTDVLSKELIHDKQSAFAHHLNNYLKCNNFPLDLTFPLTIKEISNFDKVFELWEKPDNYTESEYNLLRELAIENFCFYQLKKTNVVNEVYWLWRRNHITPRKKLKFLLQYFKLI